MISISLSLLLVHFIADFLLQSDWMAVNKSKHWDVLACHCLVYAGCFLLFWGWQFAVITFILHYATDFWTSRLTYFLWRKEERHWFFAAIGADQLIHFASLAYTFSYLNL